MSDDIVDRLRNYESQVSAAPPYYRELIRIAADEIEWLRSERFTYFGDKHSTKGEPCTQNTPS